MKVEYVADVGNSAIKWGRGLDGPVEVICHVGADDPADWLRAFKDTAMFPPSSEEGRRWAVAGSHPARRDRHGAWLTEHHQQVLVLKDYQQLPLEVSVRNPEGVGLDRLLNAVAVNSRRKTGEAAVIVDVGSAVTVDLVDESGIFQGGAIFPGLRLMGKSLHDHTAVLPEVWTERPMDPPGKFTEEAIAVGIFHAVAGGIERLIGRYESQVKKPLTVFVGGGDGGLVSLHLTVSDVVSWPAMTLEGIRLSAEHD